MSIVLDAGFFYCPYIPIQFIPRKTWEQYIAGRREHLMKCPSHPYSCTGECKTEVYAYAVEDSLKKETFMHQDDMKKLGNVEQIKPEIGFKSRYKV